MSVLCCHIPNFSLKLTYRAQPHLVQKPLVLLDPEEQICAVSHDARRQGIYAGMPIRQAQMHCPDLHFCSLDLQRCQSEQSAFLGELGRWDLPVEANGFGSAYIDLLDLAPDVLKAQSMAAELGRQIRTNLGESLQPALGWDSGKFTARAAAACAAPGHMRLVSRTEETPFLMPLAITLLPLPVASLRQLHWLGIQTLGQFAQLPVTAVWQRFGSAGKLAHQWAQGHDDRPVQPTLRPSPQSFEVDFDPPTDRLSPVVQALMAQLASYLQTLQDQLEGCRRLRLQLYFIQGDSHTLDLDFIEPVSQPARLQHRLTQHLQTLNWPAPLQQATLLVLETAELPACQLTLFPEFGQAASSLLTVARKLSGRYGNLFFRGEYVEENHPLAEQRTQLYALA